MNIKRHWGLLGRVFGLLSVTAALVACDGSDGSVASVTPTSSSSSTRTLPDVTPTLSPSSTRTLPDVTPTLSPSSPRTLPGVTPNPSSTSSETLPGATTDSVTLSWSAPTENTDGNALTNLAGYNIHYGTSASAMTQEISINTVGILDYVVSGLSAGTWYFQVIAVNSAGIVSGPSNVVSKTI